MSKISFKAVIIGGIVDIISTNILELPLMSYVLYQLLKSGTPQEDIHQALMSSYQDNALFHFAAIGIGLLCSVLGGYVAARIAKHDEMLNGALSSFICVLIGFYSIFGSSGSQDVPLWQHVLALISSPVVAGFGGYLRVLQLKKAVVA